MVYKYETTVFMKKFQLCIDFMLEKYTIIS
jgi:hypothetical protein